MSWRAAAAVAGVAAVVAAAVSVTTTLVLVDRVQPPTGVATSGSPTNGGGSPSGEPSDFAGVFRAVSSGVVLVRTTACDRGGIGSGFLIGPDLVATVAHVVDGAHSIVLSAGTTSQPGVLVGIDRAHEVALIRAAHPFEGHVFTFATGQPEVGTEVVALGFPLGGGLAPARGAVSGLGRALDVGSATPSPVNVAPSTNGQPSGSPTQPPSASPALLTGLLQVDGLINPGNSGGPLLRRDGQVVGIVEARASEAVGIAYAIPATTAAPLLAHWQNSADLPQPQVAGACSDPVGPPDSGGVEVSDRSGSPDGPRVADLFARHAAAINEGDYSRAWALHSRRARSASFSAWVASERSSLIFDLALHRVSATTAGDLEAEVSFTSVQDAALGPSGQSCSLWHLSYLLVYEDGDWRIDRSTRDTGAPTAC